MSSMLTLDCLVLGEDEGHIFTVKISNTENVATLKDAIKEKKDPFFQTVAADALDLWNVSMPYNDDFEENLKNLDVSKQRLLSARQKLSTSFKGQSTDDCLAIVIRAPGGVSNQGVELPPLLRFVCLVAGDKADRAFVIDIAATSWVAHLKEAIKEEKKIAFRNIDADALDLWKVSIPIDSNFDKHFAQLKLFDESRLSPVENLSGFSSQLAEKHLHIVVKALPSGAITNALSRRSAIQGGPDEEDEDVVIALRNTFEQSCKKVISGLAADDRPAKRQRLSNETPCTPPSKERAGSVDPDSPTKRLTAEETVTAMEGAIKPFEKYLVDLASGKLDMYLDSFEPEGKEAYKAMGLPDGPNLLLHQLGIDKQHEDRLNNLFQSGITQLFGVSGSGKTRLTLEGLCRHWGIYLSCRASLGMASGADDVQQANRAFEDMTGTNHLDTPSKPGTREKNITSARRAYSQLLCARIFVLKKLLENIPPGTTAASARRRWVLAQILPPYTQLDLFVTVLRAIRGGVTNELENITFAILDRLVEKCSDIFPCATGLFVVIDEAQTATRELVPYFRSSDDINPRPILREVVKSLHSSRMFSGVILSGTGLSLPAVENALLSFSAKFGIMRRVFTDTGRFTKDDSAQEPYIKRYLMLSSNASDQRLLERIQYWLSGRYRLTASIMELLVLGNNIPRHRVLTEFVKQITGFTLTDATDLECSEPPLSDELSSRIQALRAITTTNQLFTRDHVPDNLIQTLRRIMMRWMVGSQPTIIEGQMHEAIALGIGFLQQEPGKWFDPNKNYPVFIDEPLVVLDVSRHFEQHDRISRKGRVANTFSDARNCLSQGFVEKEVVLLTLVEAFGGKAIRLNKALITDQPWGLRKAKLVSLRGTVDGGLHVCDVSWTTGGLDCFGFKAKDPKYVLLFLEDPHSKAFLFPDNNMGPDLLCFFQDEETMELIIVVVQVKLPRDLDKNTGKWLSAIDSINPKNFYTYQKKNDEKRYPYAPGLYPNLHHDISGAVEKILGKEIYLPVVDTPRQQLRSKRNINHEAATWKFPRFLQVIATPNNELCNCLKAESMGDVAVMRWHNIEKYLGTAMGAAAMDICAIVE